MKKPSAIKQTDLELCGYCGQRVAIAEVFEHEKAQCPERPVRCSHCRMMYPLSLIVLLL